mmetsp:Transcript_12224/g.16587  ORF Transcript_12224/g.16587 Transcript_12224/m.16587 type:complete len:378 (+) Transcript_12224:1364-2497(+)
MVRLDRKQIVLVVFRVLLLFQLEASKGVRSEEVGVFRASGAISIGWQSTEAADGKADRCQDVVDQGPGVVVASEAYVVTVTRFLLFQLVVVHAEGHLLFFVVPVDVHLFNFFVGGLASVSNLCVHGCLPFPFGHVGRGRLARERLGRDGPAAIEGARLRRVHVEVENGTQNGAERASERHSIVLCVRRDHLLGLFLDAEGVLEHIENEGEVDVTEVIKFLKLDLVGLPEVVVEQVAVVPRVVCVCSSHSEEKIRQLDLRLLPGSCQVPQVLGVHKVTVFVEAVASVEVTLHVVTCPKCRQIVVVNRVLEVLIFVNISSEFSNDGTLTLLRLGIPAGGVGFRRNQVCQCGTRKNKSGSSEQRLHYMRLIGKKCNFIQL